MSAGASRRLPLAAAVSLVCHLVAGAAMLLVLRRGLGTNQDIAERMAFVSRQAGLWRAAWLTWNAAALSVLWFFVEFERVRGRSGRGWIAGLAVSAVLFDLSAEAVMMLLLPVLAGRGDEAGFLVWDRRAVLLTGLLANGLYTLAAAAAVAASKDVYPRRLNMAGAAVVAGGAALSFAAAAGSVEGMFWSNVVLLPAILAWQGGIAWSESRDL